MRQDRFLMGILAGIAVLAALALTVHFTQRGRLTYGAENTPEGVVRNYIMALQRRDYERAYSYLSDFTNKPDMPQFLQPFTSYQSRDVSLTGIEVTSVSTAADGQSALVYLSLLRGGSGLFDQGYRESNNAELVLQAGSWKIRNMPYPFWNYEWSSPLSPAVPEF
ncbi:MAG: hypothetical protein IT308_00025 [Anaerolineaceae bacterium]|nr:hypothetical protein [Anaerolineaceae bacterium]